MKYYKMHELVYQKIAQKGLVSWDKDADMDAVWANSINTWISSFLKKQNLSMSALSVLDLGTGAGGSALFCARGGAKSVGVDISETAIAMAKKENDNLRLNCRFLVQDVLNLDLDQKFDLILDSSFLHCLVGDLDRQSFYEVCKKHLNNSGHLIMHTMIASDGMVLFINRPTFLYRDEILYSKGFNDQVTDRITIEDISYFPHRTVLTQKHLIQEIETHGFTVVDSEITEYKGNPSVFKALLKINTSNV